MAKIVNNGTLHEKIGGMSYQMPKELAKEILKTRKGTDLKMDPKEYLIKYVNEDCGLLYKCVEVTTI